MTDTLAQLSTTSTRKKRPNSRNHGCGRPMTPGRRMRTQEYKKRKRNEKYEMELKAAAEEQAATSNQRDNHLNQPTTRRFRLNSATSDCSKQEMPSSSPMPQHYSTTTSRRNRRDEQPMQNHDSDTCRTASATASNRRCSNSSEQHHQDTDNHCSDTAFRHICLNAQPTSNCDGGASRAASANASNKGYSQWFVQHQQNVNTTNEYAETFIKRDIEEQYYLAKTYYPKPTMKTVHTSEESDFSSD